MRSLAYVVYTVHESTTQVCDKGQHTWKAAACPLLASLPAFQISGKIIKGYAVEIGLDNYSLQQINFSGYFPAQTAGRLGLRFQAKL